MLTTVIGLQVDGWGRDKFMPSAMLRDSSLGFRVNDVVIFKVEIWVYGDLEASPVHDQDNCAHLTHSLEGCLRSMLDDSETSDVDIIAGGTQECFHVHRCILSARSEVFRVMFTSNFKEKFTGRVYIPDVESVVMREVLLHMYTDSLPGKVFLTDYASPLLLVALKYQLPCLLDCAETFLISCLTPECVSSMLVFAESICCSTLKKKTMMFIAQNSCKVMQLREFHELEGQLLEEVTAMIEYVNKKRGCRGSVEKERKMPFGCNIM